MKRWPCATETFGFRVASNAKGLGRGGGEGGSTVQKVSMGVGWPLMPQRPLGARKASCVGLIGASTASVCMACMFRTALCDGSLWAVG